MFGSVNNMNNMNMNVNTNPQMNGGMIMNGTMGNMGQMANNQQMQPNHMQQNQQRQVRSRHTFFLVIVYIQLNWTYKESDRATFWKSKILPLFPSFEQSLCLYAKWIEFCTVEIWPFWLDWFCLSWIELTRSFRW